MLIYKIKIVKQRIEKKLSKIKEKKLNSIKSEMEEIKKFIVSNNDSDSTEKNKTDYLNNKDEDTVILTQIVQDEKNINNNTDLSVIKKDLLELKKTIEINTNLLNEILLRIK